MFYYNVQGIASTTNRNTNPTNVTAPNTTPSTGIELLKVSILSTCLKSPYQNTKAAYIALFQDAAIR